MNVDQFLAESHLQSVPNTVLDIFVSVLVCPDRVH